MVKDREPAKKKLIVDLSQTATIKNSEENLTLTLAQAQKKMNSLAYVFRLFAYFEGVCERRKTGKIFIFPSATSAQLPWWSTYGISSLRILKLYSAIPSGSLLLL